MMWIHFKLYYCRFNDTHNGEGKRRIFHWI
jgi:hypothetical protein